MSDNNFIPYARQSISPEDIEEVRQTLTQPMITRGPKVEEFEQAFAQYCGCNYAVSFNSGSTALMAAYFAANLDKNDRILSTPNTFVATVGSGMQFNATPVFVDIDRSTGNMSLEQLFLNLNHPHSRGKTVVVPVHFAGIPVDMQTIDTHIADIDTVVIEDAAHAVGSHYKDGSKVGSCNWSHMTVFSFHPAKTITTGEGGMVTTNDEQLWHRLQIFRNNGIERNAPYLQGTAAPGYYEVTALTSNYHLTDIQAALGLSQLKRLDTFVSARQKLMHTYRQELASLKNVRLFIDPEDQHIAHHLCVVQIDFQAYKTSRTAVMEALKQRGIGTQVHYIPLYRHPVFANPAGDLSEYFPETEAYYSQALSLPLYADLTYDEVRSIVKALKAALQAK